MHLRAEVDRCSPEIGSPCRSCSARPCSACSSSTLDAELRRDVLEVLRDRRLVVRRLRELLERLRRASSAWSDQARELHAPRVVAELLRQPVALVEAREARLEVLLGIRLPAEFLLSSCIASSFTYGT